MQDQITHDVARALGMTADEAEAAPRRAARRAAAVLRANGYVRKYCHVAWERGMRWYYRDATTPERDVCATSLLGIALIEGRITKGAK